MGNRCNRHGTKSACRSWDRRSGIHWEILKPIQSSIQSSPSQYSHALLNVSSLSSKLIQIQHLLEISSLDILALMETWTKQNQCLGVIKGKLSTMGYNLVAAHRPDKTGCVGIIHRDTLKVRKVDAGRSLTFECLILELAGRSIISIIYHPPNSSIPTFLEEFTDWVYHLLNKYMDPLILGDFNVNLAEQGEQIVLLSMSSWKHMVLCSGYWIPPTRVAAYWTMFSSEKPFLQSWTNQQF